MIFLDTGAFLARYVQRDQYHAQALRHWRQVRRERRRCFTSNFILDETLTLLARRAGYAFAAARAHNLFHSRVLIILRPELADEQEAVTWFRKLADQQVSFTDCVSFVLMRKYRLTQAFTFDRHFVQAGFVMEPAMP